MRHLKLFKDFKKLNENTGTIESITVSGEYVTVPIDVVAEYFMMSAAEVREDIAVPGTGITAKGENLEISIKNMVTGYLERISGDV